MQTQPKAIIFARVSSKAQEDEGYSLDSQLKLLRNYCKKKRLSVVKEFKIAETASKAQRRTVFHEMLKYITKNRINHFTVEKTDRAVRNIKDAAYIYDWIEGDERRVLHCVKEGLELHKWSTSQVKFMWGIFVTFAKQYTDSLREEAMKGWDEKLAQGWLPAPPPPGYRTVTENSKKIHVVNEETAPLAERAFRLYLEPGQTVSAVTDELAECGLTTRKGRPLSKTSVHLMLHNPFYMGVIRFNGHEYPGAHEPLISAELFNAVQEKLGERRQTKIVRHDPLFRGQIMCQSCGGMVTWQLQRGRYYGACKRQNPQCKLRPLVREDYLEDLVREELRSIDKKDADRQVLRKLKQKLLESHQPYIGQHRLGVMKLINRQISRNEIMQDNLYEDKIAGLITEELYQMKLEDIEVRLVQLRERLRRLEQLEGKAKSAEAVARTIVGLYESESKVGKRLILASLLKLSLVDGRVNITRR